MVRTLFMVIACAISFALGGYYSAIGSDHTGTTHRARLSTVLAAIACATASGALGALYGWRQARSW